MSDFGDCDRTGASGRTSRGAGALARSIVDFLADGTAIRDVAGHSDVRSRDFDLGDSRRPGRVHRGVARGAATRRGLAATVTIEKWYQNWRRNEAKIVERYGERWFRLWSFFLAWSALIGSQGSSALFMITMTKNLKNDRETLPKTSKLRFSRRRRFIGPRAVATQQ